MHRISSRTARLPILTVCLALTFLSFAVPPAFAADPDKTLGEILFSAESLFHALKERNYPGIWESLTRASRNTIVDDTHKEVARSGGREIPKEDLRKDFSQGGPIAKGYWNGFLEHFDPDLALEQSKWEKGSIGKDRAEILITYRKSEKPAQLKLYREDGGWKVGLVETFWTRE